jgi:hypothetical protein
MLLVLAKKLLADVKASETKADYGNLPVGSLTAITVDRSHPSYGEVNGEPVTILGEANMVGFSPVTLLRDGDGEEAWIPKHLIRNTDPRLAPIAFGPTARVRKSTK